MSPSPRLLSLVLGVLAGAGLSTSHAQGTAAFPSRPVTMIMPFSPGSSTDMEARIYQEELQPVLKVPLLLDYKPSGGGVLANIALAKAPPDGHTIAWSSATIALHPATRPDIPYDMFRDLAPVTQTTKRTFVLVVSPHLPVNSYEEFIAYARANPGKVAWGTVGAGGSMHMTGEWLASATGIKLTFVHYKGGTASDLDLIAGRIGAAPKGLISTVPLLKARKVKALALVTADRAAQMPDLRPISELGIPGFNYPGWAGIFAPGATPPAIQIRIADAFRQALNSPRAMKEWAANDTHVVASTPEAFRQMLTVEVARWKKLAQDNNIRLSDENN